MQKSLKTQIANAVDTALAETGLTMQERVATGALKVWTDTQQNEPYAISEADANVFAFNAQRKDSLARNKRLKVQVAVPEAIVYETSKFTTFDNNVARVRLSILNAPHLPKALKIVDKLVQDGLGQPGLMLHKAMEAVGAGTGETWDKDKRAKAAKSTTEREARVAKAITAEGFNTQLDTLIEKAGEHQIAIAPNAEGFYRFADLAKPKIDDMPDAPDAGPEVMDQDAIAEMMNAPAFKQAMAAFMVAAKK